MSKALRQPHQRVIPKVENVLRQGLFMISCAARTGSSMLVNMLQSHPDIACHMEIFNPAKVEGFWGVYRERLVQDSGCEEKMRALRSSNPTAYIYKFAFDSQGRRCVGFKFKHEEFLMPAFAGARTAIVTDRDIKIVLLRRRNLLRRYLSHAKAMTSGVTMRRKGDPPLPTAPIVVDPRACLADFQNTLRREKFVADMLRNHKVHEIFYEDLVGTESEKFVSELLGFLGVQPAPLRTVHEKLSGDSLKDQILNYDELRRTFAGGPYETFLHPGQ